MQVWYGRYACMYSIVRPLIPGVFRVSLLVSKKTRKSSKFLHGIRTPYTLIALSTGGSTQQDAGIFASLLSIC